ncbi:hypothetical protein [Streptomyces sp. NPDC127118]|uniref:hypothetical protein n=1 Tax=Streptomyces sp. NPDC127118 TaxID=3345369 RepID=UPI003642EC53
MYWINRPAGRLYMLDIIWLGQPMATLRLHHGHACHQVPAGANGYPRACVMRSRGSTKALSLVVEQHPRFI